MSSDLTDRIKKVFDFAADATKLLLTLSTAILALTITLADKIVQPSSPHAWVFLLAAWILFLIFILSGIWILLQLTTSLANNNTLGQPMIADPNITKPAMAQVLLFVMALGALIGFGLYVLM